MARISSLPRACYICKTFLQIKNQISLLCRLLCITLKWTSVLPNKVPLNRLLPFWLDSPSSDPFLRGRAASPGTLGLSTYLGFLIGPATGISWVCLVFSRETSGFICTVSILCDAKKAEELFLTYTAATVKTSELLHFHSYEKETLFGLLGVKKPAGKQNQSACCDKLEKFSCICSEWLFHVQTQRTFNGSSWFRDFIFHYNRMIILLSASLKLGEKDYRQTACNINTWNNSNPRSFILQRTFSKYWHMPWS